MIKSNVNYFPHFSDFFLSQEPELDNLFDNPPIDIYICILSSLSECYFFKESDDYVLRNLLSNQSTEMKREVGLKFSSKFSRLSGIKSIVNLIQYLLINYSTSSIDKGVEGIDELNLFKAILIFNKRTYHDSLQPQILKYETLHDRAHTTQRKSLFPFLYAQQQFGVFGEYIYLITKARLVFNELTENVKLKQLGELLLKESCFKDFEEWLSQYDSIVRYWSQRIEGEQDKFIGLKREYLDHLSFDLKVTDKEKNKTNYQLFVEHPFYKRIEGEPFPLISYYFLIKLLDNEIYFSLKNINDTFPKATFYLKELKSVFSKEIMEWKFFRRILASLFPTPKYQISFLDEGNSKNISKPDAYVIKGKHHLLFEFKDSMTNSNILETNDFSKIYKNLLRNYATERSSGSKKTQNKGIYQLLDFIKNRIINSSNIKNLSIYPILVVTDDTLMTPGTRDFLNNIWTFEISKLEISNRISIKPLALIHLSTVFNLAFSERKEFDFVGLLLKYYQKVASRNKRISKEKNLSHGLKYSDSFENVLGLDSPPGYGFNVLKFKAFITELGMSIYL